MMNYLRLFVLFLPGIFFFQSTSLGQPCGNPAPVSDPCDPDIPVLCGLTELDNYCYDMPTESTVQNFPGCSGNYALHNDSWFSFVAGAEYIEMEIVPSDCSGAGGGNDGLQAGIYGGECDNLNAIALQCACVNNNTITLASSDFVIGQTYYIVVDGCNGSVCHIDVDVIEGEEPPAVDDPTEPNQIALPEFEGPDTICLGASDVVLSIGGMPYGASQLNWIFPDGTVIEGPIGSPALQIPNIYFQEEGPLEICVEAFNDCNVSEGIACREYYVAPIDPVYEEFTVCEGEPFSWDNGSINTNGITQNMIVQQTATREGTYSCDYQANLELTILNENDEAPTQVEDAICYGDVYNHPGTNYTTEGINSVDQEYIGTTPDGCDTFFNFTIEVVGGEFFINTPEDCNGDGTFTLESLFTPITAYNYVPLDNPDLTVNYQWIVNGDEVGTDPDFIVDQDLIEEYNYLNISFEVTMDYPGLESPCVFNSNTFQLDPQDYLPSIDSISGPESLCFESSGTYEVYFQDPQNQYFTDNVTGFIWEAPIGVSVTNNGDNPVIVAVGSGAQAGDICVEIQTDCGFIDYACIPVDINNPVDPEIGDVANDPCSFSYTFTPEVANNGKWLVVSQPDGATVEFDDETLPGATVSVDSPGIYDLAWREGVPGCEKFDTVSLTFTGRPLISDIVIECNNPPTDYVVTFMISGGAPPYMEVDGKGTISGNMFTSDPIPQMTSDSFQIVDDNGCMSEVINVNKICDCDTDAGTMEADTLEACGSTGCVVGVPMDPPGMDGDDVIQFALHEGTGNSLQGVIEIRNDPMFCYKSGMDYGTLYYISRIVGSDDGSGAVDLNDGCLSVAPGQPAIWYEQPVADAGVAMIDSCGMVTTLMANPSIGQGSWSMVSGPGSADFDSMASPSTTVTVSEFGTYVFEWSENNRGCVDADSVTVVFHDPPVLADGSLNAECLPNLDYILTFEIEGGTPPYVLLSGDGTLDGSMYRDTLDNGEMYDIVITDAFGCGPVELSGMQDCNCNSVAGMMDSTVLDTCIAYCVTALHLGMDSLEADDTSAFVLHDVSSANLGTVIGMNTSGTFCYADYAGDLTVGQTYYISYIVGNDDGTGAVDLADPCLSVAPGQPVVFYEPPFVNAGSDDETCDFTYTLLANQDNGSGTWSLLNGPGTADFSQQDSLESDVTVSEHGTYCFTWTGTYKGCTSVDTVCVEFLDAPEVVPSSIQIECNALNTEYVVSFNISGGESPYIVSGDPGQVNGNFFKSDPIPSGDSYTFYVSDANACDTFVLSDSYTCECTSDAGIMSQDTVSACPGDSISVSEPTLTELDPEDIIVYVLHEGSSDMIVNKIAENKVPTFGFDPGQMNYNQVYYISSMVGNDDGSGSVDTMDACYVVSEGTPVVWYEHPTAFVDPDIDTITCEQEEVILNGSSSTSVTGKGLDFIWTNAEGMNVGNTAQVTVSMPGDYTLTVIDRGSGCEDQITVNVPRSEDTPLARINEPQTLNCDRTVVVLDGSTSSQGPMFRIEWSSNPAGLDISNPNILTPEVSQGGEYILTITNDQNGCTSTASVTVAVDTTHPVADAEALGTLDCSNEEVQIDATASSQGPAFDYTWSPTAGMTGSDGLQPIVTLPGLYTLEVEDTGNGCTSSVTVEVVQDTNRIRDAVFDIRNPSCDGQATGRIEVEQVIGGTPPYSFVLDGGAAQNTIGVFEGLAAGVYELEIIDSKGCRLTISGIELIEPAPLELYLPPSVKIELGDSVGLMPEILPVDRDIVSYQWTASPADSTMSCDTCRNLTAWPRELTVYKITVVDENGCVTSALSSVAVEIPRNVYIPNIFTPNGDGVNDLFYLQAKDGEIREVESMEIFDRWGNKVFERKNISPNAPEVGWDGTREGQKLNPAVFVYVFEIVYFDGVTEQIKGDVTLKR